MSKKHKRMIVRALKRFDRITPCVGRATLSECFSSFNDNLILWFNTVDGSTHIEMQKD